MRREGRPLEGQLKRQLNLPRGADVVESLAGVSVALGNAVHDGRIEVRRAVACDGHAQIKEIEELGVPTP